MFLQMTELNYVSPSQCASQRGNSRSYMSAKVCARDPGTSGICFGDSGGPLVVGSYGKWTFVGIASYVSVDRNKNCNHAGPDVYTRVTSYLDFINPHL